MPRQVGEVFAHGTRARRGAAAAMIALDAGIAGEAQQGDPGCRVGLRALHDLVPASAGLAVDGVDPAAPFVHRLRQFAHASRSSTISPWRTTMLQGLKPIQ